MGYNQIEIEELVRQVVSRTLGVGQRPPGVGYRPSNDPGRRLIVDEETVRQMPAGSTQPVGAGVLITPLARQIAMERRVKLVEDGPKQVAEPALNPSPAATRRWPAETKGQAVIALGADHGGYALKEQLKEVVATAGYGLVDCGAYSTAAVDYPDFAYAVARLVADGRAWRGIIIDGAGIGSCMAANKVPGVRAAMCYDQATAVNSREHNNANVLTLGAGLIGPNLAQQIVETWLATEFAGGRHAKRVEKINEIDRRYSK